MPGDKVEIGEDHIKKANVILKALIPMMAEQAKKENKNKFVLTVCGGSGVGKSEIASLLSHYFNQNGIGSYTMSGDNYPFRIPMYNDAERLRVFRYEGIRKMLSDGVYTEARFKTLHGFMKNGDDANKNHVAEYPWMASYLEGGRKGLEGYLGTPNETNFKEVEGIHSRTNFDLSQHAKFSGKKIEYFDPETNESYTPYVIETSIGVDRMFLSVVCHAYQEEKLEGGDSRVVLKLPAALAPVKLAVLPLVKKDGLPEKAHEIMQELKFHFNCKYEEKDSIGKRYRRQDAIGTPFCITIDHDTLKDNCVTLRDRDTMEQTRVPVEGLRALIEDKVSITSLLKKLQ